MRFFSWVFNIALFVVALAFALSNTQPVDLRFLVGELVWRAPLVVFLLIFLISGVVLGLLAAVPALFRQRREIARLAKELRHAGRPGAAAPAPVPAAPVPGASDPVPNPATGLGI